MGLKSADEATAMAAVAQAGGLPEPEEVFLTWLLAQPAQADLAAAATLEVERLRAYRGVHPGPKQLGRIFRAFIAGLESPGGREALPVRQ